MNFNLFLTYMLFSALAASAFVYALIKIFAWKEEKESEYEKSKRRLSVRKSSKLHVSDYVEEKKKCTDDTFREWGKQGVYNNPVELRRDYKKGYDHYRAR